MPTVISKLLRTISAISIFSPLALNEGWASKNVMERKFKGGKIAT
jgi:hypothetical protein